MGAQGHPLHAGAVRLAHPRRAAGLAASTPRAGRAPGEPAANRTEQAPGQAERDHLAEVEARLAACGGWEEALVGELRSPLFGEVDLSDYRYFRDYLSPPARRVLGYIAGWKRRRLPFKRWCWEREHNAEEVEADRTLRARRGWPEPLRQAAGGGSSLGSFGGGACLSLRAMSNRRGRRLRRTWLQKCRASAAGGRGTTPGLNQINDNQPEDNPEVPGNRGALVLCHALDCRGLRPGCQAAPFPSCRSREELAPNLMWGWNPGRTSRGYKIRSGQNMRKSRAYMRTMLAMSTESSTAAIMSTQSSSWHLL